MKPGKTEEEKAQAEENSQTPGSKGKELAKGSSFLFGTPKASEGGVFGSATKPVFQFNKPTVSPLPGSSTSTPATSTAEAKPVSSTASSEHKQFGIPAFTFNPEAQTPSKDVKSPVKSPILSPTSPGYYQSEDDGEHIHFEPVVKMRDDYQHVTGEEDYSTLFSERGKLFRYIDSQWKERGLGDIKIQHHAQSATYRLLMRREQVHKVCLNHTVQSNMELKPMPNLEGKAWTWHAYDYSEGEGRHEMFAIRFKTTDSASEFKAVFDNAKTGQAPQVKSPFKAQSATGDSGKLVNLDLADHLLISVVIV